MAARTPAAKWRREAKRALYDALSITDKARPQTDVKMYTSIANVICSLFENRDPDHLDDKDKYFELIKKIDLKEDWLAHEQDLAIWVVNAIWIRKINLRPSIESGFRLQCVYCGNFCKLDKAESRYACACGASVSAHKDDFLPMGLPAQKDVRFKRRDLHLKLDKWWKKAKLKRHEIYNRISQLTGIPPAYCHVGYLVTDMEFHCFEKAMEQAVYELHRGEKFASTENKI